MSEHARMLHRHALGFALVLCSCASSGASSPPPATTSASTAAPAATPAAAQSAGAWKELFDGKTLEGWTTSGSAVWRPEDGADGPIIAGGQDGDPKRSGMLKTAAQYQDFELELEFLIDEHGKYNSGVYLRNRPDAGGRTGYQVNIGRGAAGEFCGGIYTDRWLAKGDEQDTIRKVLAWNHLWIRAVGAHVEVKLNGAPIVDFTDPAPRPEYLQPGVVGFQTYGAEGHAGFVKLRKLRLREIK
jgi:hypothetical protein